jgi:hypothetical protein
MDVFWVRTLELLGVLGDLFDQFRNGKRFAFDFVKADCVDEVSAANEHPQLTHIELRYKYLLVRR